MSSDRLARVIAESLARHQSRGLVDGTTDLSDVVIHGRVDLLAVADEVLDASIAQLKPPKKSWAGWFICSVDARRQVRRHERKREKLADRVNCGSNAAEAAIARLRIRKFGF